MIHAVRRGVGLVVAAVLGAAVLPGPAPALAAPVPVSGAAVSAAYTSAVTDPAKPFSVTNQDGDGVTLAGTTLSGADQTVGFVPGTGTTLTAGTTLPLTNGGGASGIWMYLTGVVSVCDVASGTVQVLEVQRDDTGRLTGVALDWSGQCNGSQGRTATSGQLRWNSSLGYGGLEGPNRTTTFPQGWIGEAGASSTLRWTAGGTLPVTPPPARIVTTESPASFFITADGCKDATAPLQPGASCDVTVRTAPRTEYVPNALLVLGDPAVAPSYGAGGLEVHGVYGAKGTYQPLRSQRILDTRTGLGSTSKAMLGPGRSMTLRVLGRGGVPAAYVSAVTLNLTLVGTTSPTYLTAYPGGTARPTVSSINAPAKFTGANSITVRPGADGTIVLYNAAGSTHVLADVTGFYSSANGVRSPGTDFHIVAPERAVDTRSDGGGPLKAGYWFSLGYDYPASVGTVRAYALNVTVTGATSNGYVTVWSGYDDPSTTADDPDRFSTLNYTKGSTRSNTVVTSAETTNRGSTYGPGFAVFNGGSTGSAHVIVDVVGVYTDQGAANATRFRALTAPRRIVDSRTGLGARTWSASSTRTVLAPPAVAGYDTWALLGNAALVRPTSNTYLTLWRTGTARPATSNLNAAKGSTVANGAMVPVGGSNDFDGWNAAGSVDVLYDVVGSFEAFPASIEALTGASTTSSRATSAPAARNAAGVPGAVSGTRTAISVHRQLVR